MQGQGGNLDVRLEHRVRRLLLLWGCSEAGRWSALGVQQGAALSRLWRLVWGRDPTSPPTERLSPLPTCCVQVAGIDSRNANRIAITTNKGTFTAKVRGTAIGPLVGQEGRGAHHNNTWMDWTVQGHTYALHAGCTLSGRQPPVFSASGLHHMIAQLPPPSSPQRVVVALPLGVLKHGDVQWQPPLPATNQQALDQLSMGLLNKVRPDRWMMAGWAGGWVSQWLGGQVGR